MSSISEDSESRKKKILWSVPRSFLPICDGASKANASLLEAFFSVENGHATDFEVTLLIFTPEGEGDDPALREKYLSSYPLKDVVILKKRHLASGVKRVFQVLRNLVSQEPLTASFFDLSINQTKLIELDERQFDYVIIDGLHTFCGLKDRFRNAKFIYRSHNVEYDLWNIDDATVISQIILRNQSQKMKNLEREMIYRSLQVWTIAKEDRQSYFSDFNLSLVESKKIHYLPMAIPFNTYEHPEHADHFHFLFVGKLDWQPNSEGLMWLLQNVVPQLNENIQLSIVGKGNFPRDEFRHLERVNFLGFVEDLDSLYKECDACLIPIFSGSGTRIKVIEALAQGTPLLTTTFGIQGSGMNESHCCIADTPEEWVEYLNHWQRGASLALARQAQDDLASLYGHAALVPRIEELL